jgi:quinolinate synthase
MAMNGLRNLLAALQDGRNEVQVEESVRLRAAESLSRMMGFSFAPPAGSCAAG